MWTMTWDDARPRGQQRARHGEENARAGTRRTLRPLRACSWTHRPPAPPMLPPARAGCASAASVTWGVGGLGGLGWWRGGRAGSRLLCRQPTPPVETVPSQLPACNKLQGAPRPLRITRRCLPLLACTPACGRSGCQSHRAPLRSTQPASITRTRRSAGRSRRRQHRARRRQLAAGDAARRPRRRGGHLTVRA